MTTIDISHSLSLNILLGDPPDSVSSYHYSYHAGDSIQGSISIKSDVDLQFETLDVFLIGEESTTRHDRNPRQFHSMQYPIPTSTFPPENIIQKHKQYFFRFAFPVPDTLSPESCQHPVNNDSIRQIHLQAPPSFGDPDVAGFGGKLRNDYAPTNCRIVYTIQARLSRRSLVTEMLQPILQKNLKIRLKPDSAHALVRPSPDNETFQSPAHPQKTIDIYQRFPKSRSKFKTGRLTTTIIAPPRFDVPVRETDASVRQAIRLNLHFEQDTESNDHTNTSTTSNNREIDEPTTFLPQIQSLHGSVVASTFFTKSYNADIPVKAKDRLGTKLNYTDKVLTEFTHSIASLQWAGEMESFETTRTRAGTRNSTSTSVSTSTSSGSTSDKRRNGQVDDTTTAGQRDLRTSSCGQGSKSRSFSSTLLVPVKLSHQFIIPTFHSCRVSRTYTLVLRLKVQGAPTIKIETPMFIAPAVELSRPPPYSFSGMQVVEGVEGEEVEL